MRENTGKVVLVGTGEIRACSLKRRKIYKTGGLSGV